MAWDVPHVSFSFFVSCQKKLKPKVRILYNDSKRMGSQCHTAQEGFVASADVKYLFCDEDSICKVHGSQVV